MNSSQQFDSIESDQFVFRNKHSIIEQSNMITDIIKKYSICSDIFLEVPHALIRYDTKVEQ